MGIPDLYAPGDVVNQENPIDSEFSAGISHLFQETDDLLAFLARGPDSGDLCPQMILVMID